MTYIVPLIIDPERPIEEIAYHIGNRILDIAYSKEVDDEEIIFSQPDTYVRTMNALTEAHPGSKLVIYREAREES